MPNLSRHFYVKAIIFTSRIAEDFAAIDYAYNDAPDAVPRPMR